MTKAEAGAANLRRAGILFQPRANPPASRPRKR